MDLMNLITLATLAGLILAWAVMNIIDIVVGVARTFSGVRDAEKLARRRAG